MMRLYFQYMSVKFVIYFTYIVSEINFKSISTNVKNGSNVYLFYILIRYVSQFKGHRYENFDWTCLCMSTVQLLLNIFINADSLDVYKNIFTTKFNLEDNIYGQWLKAISRLR